MARGKAHPNPKGETDSNADGNVVDIKTHTDNAMDTLKQKQLDGTGERLEIIHQCAEKIKTLSEDRKAINASVQAVREQVESFGVSKAAFDMAMRYARMDEEQRQGFDVAYAVVRKALGLPIQSDLFNAELLSEGAE